MGGDCWPARACGRGVLAHAQVRAELATIAASDTVGTKHIGYRSVGWGSDRGLGRNLRGRLTDKFICFDLRNYNFL